MRLYTLNTLLALSIPEKLAFLEKYDQNYQIFGSSSHRYRLQATWSESRIAAFEKTYGVKLPSVYRSFIHTIGNGGAGPGYGLLPLKDCDPQYGILELPFLLKDDFNPGSDEDEEPLLDELPCDEDDTACCYRYQQGSLAVSHDGCTYYARLVMNGDMCGEIWSENEGEGLLRTGLDFTAWYTNWLDSSITAILPLVNAVLSRLPYRKILRLKCPGLLEYPEVKARFIAGMLSIVDRAPLTSGKEMDACVRNMKTVYEKWRRRSGKCAWLYRVLKS